MTGCGEGGSAKELQLLYDENSVCGHVLLMENDHILSYLQKGIDSRDEMLMDEKEG